MINSSPESTSIQPRSQSPKNYILPGNIIVTQLHPSKSSVLPDHVIPGTIEQGANIPDTSLISKPDLVNNKILAALKRLSGPVQIIFKVQFLYGLRASEVLQIRNRDLMSNGLIHIRSTKNSNDRIINVPELAPFFRSAKIYRDNKIFLLSYTAYYNALKKVGISFARPGKGKNNIVTHTCRKHLFNNVMAEKDIAFDSIKNFSGHKSKKGLEYYINLDKSI